MLNLSPTCRRFHVNVFKLHFLTHDAVHVQGSRAALHSSQLPESFPVNLYVLDGSTKSQEKIGLVLDLVFK